MNSIAKSDDKVAPGQEGEQVSRNLKTEWNRGTEEDEQTNGGIDSED